MFYNKLINIYTKAEPSIDEYGVVHEGELELVDTLYVDVQPIDKLRVQKEYGIDISISWRIFSPLNQYIIDGSYIQYKDKMYKILNLMEWDDYIEFLVGGIDD